MKKMLAVMMAISVLLSSSWGIHAEELFPLILDYPEGVEDLDSAFISDEIREKNIHSGFEERQEISAVEKNSIGGQRKIVENCYTGKFALQIKQNGEDILPLLQTEYFDISTLSETEGEYSKSEDGITVVTIGKAGTISGTATPNTEVTLTINKDDEIKYLNQTTSDSEGFFSFGFKLQQYGTFKACINRVGQGSYQTEIVCSSATNTNGIKEITAKTNLVSMQVKPMYKAEKISFYTKAKVKADTGIQEKFVLIKSDKNADGVFEIGEDLSLGKWQEIELILKNIDEELAEQKVSGIYMRANEASTWIFDDLSSDYKDINTADLDLAEFAKGNVIYNDGLRFNTMEDGKFDTDAAIVSSGVDINEELYGISVETSTQSSGQISEEEESKLLLDADLTSDAWTVFDENYENKSKGVSMKSDNSILIKYEGYTEFDAGTFVTEGRSKLHIDWGFNGTAPSTIQTLKVELYENIDESPYFTAKLSFEKPSYDKECILPQIRENTIFKITYDGNASVPIKITSLKLYSLVEDDWNYNSKYSNHNRLNILELGENEYHQKIKVTDMPAYSDNAYAVENKNITGLMRTVQNSSMQTTYGSDSIFVIRVVNLGTTEPSLTVSTPSKRASYKIPFGESDIVTMAGGTVKIPLDENVLIVSIREYSKSEITSTFHYSTVDGMCDDSILSGDGNKVYYSNYLDEKCLYEYDILTNMHIKITDTPAQAVCISKDGSQLVYLSDKNYYLYDLKNQSSTQLPQGSMHSFSGDGILYILTDTDLCQYDSGALLNKFTSNIIEYTFSSNGENILTKIKSGNDYLYNLYKCYNGSFSLIESLKTSEYYTRLYLSDDLSTFYTSFGIAVDIKTGAEKKGPGTIRYKAPDNTFIVGSMSLYNPATGETYKIASVSGDVVHYNPDTGMLTVVYNGAIARCKFTAEKSSAKYLLSFDGQNTWQSYKNGRWVTVAKGTQPTQAEMDALGMSSDELNNISSAAFKRLYTNGTDILRVDIAIYMNSYSNELTPVISNITVKTVADDETRDLFSIKSKYFYKADYTRIESIFPVEDFTDASECYYLLYLGNDWLYTYKNNEIIKVTESANELFAEMNSTWIKFKQYAMTAKELRNIPSEALTELLINPDYANDKFGIVYVMKGENENANVVTFKVQADTKYIDTDEVVIEIVMNGNDTKVIDSREFSKEVVENFLSWLENRQNGKGDIFYNFKNGPMQYFINYYMINSINVYDAAEYARAGTVEEQTAVVTE